MESSVLTITIVIATVAVTIVSFSNQSLYHRLLFSSWHVIVRQEWWRMVSHGFVHADYAHLIVNMLILFVFGGMVEHVFGGIWFLLLYFCGIIAGAVAGLLQHRQHGDYQAVGASAGVSAMVAAVTTAFPDLTMGMLWFPIPMPAWLYSCIYIIYSIVAGKGRWDNVGHNAHLAGLIVGVLLTIVYQPALIMNHGLYILAMIAAGAIGYGIARYRGLA
jgi:membrane associated rhomboid family serine protease